MDSYIQHCFGDYEKEFCTGNPEAEDIYESLPCTRRDVCEAFQLYLKEVGGDRLDYCRIERGEDEDGEEIFYVDVDDEQVFLNWCGKLVERYGTHPERIRKTSFKVVEKPKKKKRKKTKQWKKGQQIRIDRLKRDRSKDLEGLLERFRYELNAKLPVEHGLADMGRFPLPGQIFVVNRTRYLRHEYISFFFRPYFTEEVEILRLHPQYIKRGFRAVFCSSHSFTEKVLNAEFFEFLGLKKDGPFYKTKFLDSVGLSVLTEAFVKFFHHILEKL